MGDSSSALSGPFTLALVGDVMLGRMVNETIVRHGSGYPWGDVPPELEKADLFLINLEFSLTGETQPMDRAKAFFFRVEPFVVKALEAAGIDFASVANNHILDFGDVGLLDTVETLDRASIAHAGAGSNLA